jgi:hypothetical protein
MNSKTISSIILIVIGTIVEIISIVIYYKYKPKVTVISPDEVKIEQQTPFVIILFMFLGILLIFIGLILIGLS